MRARARLGVAGALIAMTALQTTIILAMASAVHPLVLGLILLRSVQPRFLKRWQHDGKQLRYCDRFEGFSGSESQARSGHTQRLTCRAG